MPPQRRIRNAPFVRSQELHHMHRILERISEYNRCNTKSRRLLLVHVDEDVGYRSVGVYGTASLVSTSFSSGFMSSLVESPARFCSEQDSNYVPYIFTPSMDQLRSSKKEMVEATTSEVLKSLGWPNKEFFSRAQPNYWPDTVPFKPVYDGMLSKEELLTVLSGFYHYHFGRLLDLGLCVHAGVGTGDVYHADVCEDLSPDLRSLLACETRARFCDHALSVGSKGVGFEMSKVSKPQWRAASPNQSKAKLSRIKSKTVLHKELNSLAHRNVYSQFVAENFGKVTGTFAQRQKVLSEKWKTCDQGAYRVQLEQKKLLEYNRIFNRGDTTRFGCVDMPDSKERPETLVTDVTHVDYTSKFESWQAAEMPEIGVMGEVQERVTEYFHFCNDYAEEIIVPEVGENREIMTTHQRTDIAQYFLPEKFSKSQVDTIMEPFRQVDSNCNGAPAESLSDR